MKKMAKRFFSSVIVLAMLMALLPASMVSAAVIDSRDFETEAGIAGFTKGTYGGSVHTWDNTVSYNGQASMKVEESSSYALVGLSKSGYKYDTTYRISARIKFADNNTDSKKVMFETWGANTVGPTTNMYWDGSSSPAYDHNSDDTLRARSGENIISDGEWHLVSSEFKFSKKDGATATQVNNMTIGIATLDSQDTYWLDDFSIVEVLSVDANKKGSFVAYKSFDGPSLELANSTATKDTTTAYEGTASAKVTATGSIVNFGTYNFEIGETYRISSYIKSAYPAGSTSENFFKYEFRNNVSGLANIVNVSSKFNGNVENRPGFSYSYGADEQYPNVGTGWSRLCGAPVNANDTDWLRHESYFKVNSTDASITSADMQVWLWTNVPSGTVINIDSVKIEKLPTMDTWFGEVAGLGKYGGEIKLTGGNTTGSGLATAYYFNTGGGDNHNVVVPMNLEKGKKYRASAKLYVPSSNKAAVDALNLETPAQMVFGTTKMDVVYDKWTDISFDIDWTNKESTTDRYQLNGISASIAKKFYFGAIDVVEIGGAAAATAGLPDISFESGNWGSWGVALPSDTTMIAGEVAKLATYSVSYGVVYVKIPDLVEGDKYLATAKLYLPKDMWQEGAQARFFLIDNQAVDGSSGYTQDTNYGMHKVVVDITEDMADKWIDVQLPFTHAKASTDTDGIYWINAVVSGIGGAGSYYIAAPKFVDVNKANIENLEILSNGTVSYTANSADYMLNYEYLDGTTVLERGMIMSGEFLPKFNLAGVEEPTVKLTATNAYGVAEETVIGILVKEDVPEVQEGEVVVNSVTILSLEGNGVDGAENISEVEAGMYVGINYTNSTEEDKNVWLMMAFYDENGLISAKKYDNITLPVSVETADVFIPEDVSEQIDFVDGATMVKAFVWDADSTKPLCDGYVID